MWGGHFSVSPDEILVKINQSIDFDKNLYAQDIAGSIAHAKMLAKCGIITKKDLAAIEKGLGQIKGEIEAGKFKFSHELEDIHMNIEARLKEIIGGAAGRLHTARSRNDQVATDFKMWVRDAYDALEVELRALMKALVAKAEKNMDVLMPGFTHLQVAQPTTFGHWFLAYFEMFKRDLSRLKDARERMNECPLGSAALCGTGFKIDRKFTAKQLKFNAPTSNSLDAVSDRDFALDFLYFASVLSIHLSRLAEEMVVFSSAQFNMIKLSEKFTTGSSIMPQKRNPDAAELARGKAGPVIGNLNSLLVTLKGLPLAYNKDTQEDKQPVFRAYEDITLCLLASIGMVKDMKINALAAKEQAESGYSTATDFADYLVRELNIPFRDAHAITGKLVNLAEKKKCKLAELSFAEIQGVEKKIKKDVYDYLSAEASVKSRSSYGGTAPAQVKKQVELAKKFSFLGQILRGKSSAFFNYDSQKYFGLIISLINFIICTIILVNANINIVFDYTSNQLSNSFLVQIENEKKVKSLEANIKKYSAIESFERLSKDDIFEYVKDWVEDKKYLDILPLPVIYEVRIKSEYAKNFDYDVFEIYLQKIDKTVTVQKDETWVDNFTNKIFFIKLFAYLILLISVASLLLVVVLVTKSSIVTNKKNVEILSLIGAEDSYISNEFSTKIFASSLKSSSLGMVFAFGFTALFAGLDADIDIAEIIGKIEFLFVLMMPGIIAFLSMFISDKVIRAYLNARYI